MSESVDDIARRVTAKGEATIKQVRRMIRRMLDKHSAAAELFLGADGQAKPEAVRWFRQLAADNYVNGGAFVSDPIEHAARSARRELALEIIRSAKLDVDRLDALIELERKTNG